MLSFINAERIDFGVDSVALYQCNPGYILVGYNNRTCLINNQTGYWDGTTPQCESKSYLL